MADTITGKLFGETPNYSGKAKKSEAQRQGLINLGMKQINAVYGGGTAPFYTLSTAQPFSSKEWGAGSKDLLFYQIDKTGAFARYAPPKPPKGGGGKGAAIALSTAGLGTPAQDLAEGNIKDSLFNFSTGGVLSPLGGILDDTPSRRELVNKGLRKGLLYEAGQDQTFEGFQPSFFQKRADDYITYALPQVSEQYRDARDVVSYGLANRGLLGSSQASQASDKLERRSGAARRSVADTAIAMSNQLERDIEGSRQEAIRQLYQSADPAQGLQSAIASASQFQRPSSFAPVANAFGDIANTYYLNKLIQSYRSPGQFGETAPTYSLDDALGSKVYSLN